MKRLSGHWKVMKLKILQHMYNKLQLPWHGGTSGCKDDDMIYQADIMAAGKPKEVEVDLSALTIESK